MPTISSHKEVSKLKIHTEIPNVAKMETDLTHSTAVVCVCVCVWHRDKHVLSWFPVFTVIKVRAQICSMIHEPNTCSDSAWTTRPTEHPNNRNSWWEKAQRHLMRVCFQKQRWLVYGWMEMSLLFFCKCFCNKFCINTFELDWWGSYCPLLVLSVSRSECSCTLPVSYVMTSLELDSVWFRRLNCGQTPAGGQINNIIIKALKNHIDSLSSSPETPTGNPDLPDLGSCLHNYSLVSCVSVW